MRIWTRNAVFIRLGYHNVSLVEDVSDAYPMLDVVHFSKKHRAVTFVIVATVYCTHIGSRYRYCIALNQPINVLIFTIIFSKLFHNLVSVQNSDFSNMSCASIAGLFRSVPRIRISKN